MKKLLFLITQSEWGGAQKYVFDLATHLRDEYDVSVACGGKSGELIQRLNREGMRIILIRSIRRRVNPFWDMLAWNEIFGILQREKPDIIHTNSTKAGILGNTAAFVAGIKRIIFTAHGFVFNEPMNKIKKMFFLFLEWFAGLAVDTVIAVSEYDKQSALKWSVYPQEKIAVIHNGIENSIVTKITYDLRKEFNIPQEAIIIGAISNFYRTKGFEYFIQSVDILKKDFPHVYFVIIGDGMFRKSIEQDIQEYGLQKQVILMGFRKDASALLSQMDVFVLSSVKEGLPFSLLEAGMLGKPVIATRVGGVPEIIGHGVNGILIPPADVFALAFAIKESIQDREKFKQYGEKLRERIIRDFTFERMVTETIKIYEKR
jgi:glycosyltransferase involved in cell wall biosynthesis